MTKFKFIILILVVFVLAGCSGKKEEELKVVKVKRGNILAEVPATGIVEPRNRLEIKPPVAGRVEKVLVKEGQNVIAGESIGTMGMTGTDSVKLHFEIRENGKSIDPIKFLKAKLN